MWRARVLLLAITALLLASVQVFLSEPARVSCVFAIAVGQLGAHFYLNSRPERPMVALCQSKCPIFLVAVDSPERPRESLLIELRHARPASPTDCLECVTCAGRFRSGC